MVGATFPCRNREETPNTGVVFLARDASGKRQDCIGVYTDRRRPVFTLLGRQAQEPDWWITPGAASRRYQRRPKRGQVIRLEGPPWQGTVEVQFRKPVDLNPRKLARRRAGAVRSRWGKT